MRKLTQVIAAAAIGVLLATPALAGGGNNGKGNGKGHDNDWGQSFENRSGGKGSDDRFGHSFDDFQKGGKGGFGDWKGGKDWDWKGGGHGGPRGPITSPVPEPETYAMMLAGLGVLGFIARRRRQQR